MSINYNPTTWINEETELNAENMNKIEEVLQEIVTGLNDETRYGKITVREEVQNLDMDKAPDNSIIRTYYSKMSDMTGKHTPIETEAVATPNASGDCWIVMTMCPNNNQRAIQLAWRVYGIDHVFYKRAKRDGAWSTWVDFISKTQTITEINNIVNTMFNSKLQRVYKVFSEFGIDDATMSETDFTENISKIIKKIDNHSKVSIDVTGTSCPRFCKSLGEYLKASKMANWRWWSNTGHLIFNKGVNNALPFTMEYVSNDGYSFTIDVKQKNGIYILSKPYSSCMWQTFDTLESLNISASSVSALQVFNAMPNNSKCMIPITATTVNGETVRNITGMPLNDFNGVLMIDKVSHTNYHIEARRSWVNGEDIIDFAYFVGKTSTSGIVWKRVQYREELPKVYNVGWKDAEDILTTKDKIQVDWCQYAIQNNVVYVSYRVVCRYNGTPTLWDTIIGTFPKGVFPSMSSMGNGIYPVTNATNASIGGVFIGNNSSLNKARLFFKELTSSKNGHAYMGTFSYPLDVEAYTSSLITTTASYSLLAEQGVSSCALNDNEAFAQDGIELKEQDFKAGGEVEATLYTVGNLEDNSVSFNEATQSVEFEKPVEEDVEVVVEVQRTEYKPVENVEEETDEEVKSEDVETETSKTEKQE